MNNNRKMVDIIYNKDPALELTFGQYWHSSDVAIPRISIESVSSLPTFVPRFGKLMADAFHCGSTIVLPQLVRLLSWTRDNILWPLENLSKISKIFF